MRFRPCINYWSKNKIERFVYQQAATDSWERAKNAAGEFALSGLEMLSAGLEVTSKIFSGLAKGAMSGLEHIEDVLHTDPKPHKNVAKGTVDPNKQPTTEGDRQDALIKIGEWQDAYSQDVIDIDYVYEPFSQALGVLEKIDIENQTKIERNNARINDLRKQRDILKVQYSGQFQRAEQMQKIYDEAHPRLKALYKQMFVLQAQWKWAKSKGDEKAAEAVEQSFRNAQAGVDAIVNSAKFAKDQLNNSSPESAKMGLIETQIATLEKENSGLLNKKYSFNSPEIANFQLINLLLRYNKISQPEADALKKESGTLREFMAVIRPYVDILADERKKASDQVETCKNRAKWIASLTIE